MKRLTALILALVICCGCGAKPAPAASSEPAESSSAVSSAQPVASSEPAAPAEPAKNDVPVKVAALKGPTAMGLVKLMEDDKAVGNYDFVIEGAIDAVTPKLLKGEVDIAAVPANVASVLYNNTKGQVKVIAVNTLGVLYIAECGDTVHSIEDLKGKTIYSAGKGATPQYALDFALSSHGIDPEKDVTIEYRSEHAECIAMLAQNPDAVAMLPQPFLTTAMLKNDKIRMAIDLNDAWSEKSGETLLTGVAVVRSEFLEKNPEKVAEFLKLYKQSAEYVNANTDSAAALIGGFDIFPEAVAKRALPYCAVTCITGDEMKDKLSSYLNVLFEQNPKSIGGTLPDEEFYHLG